MPRPNHGPGGNGSYEKAKDFKGAIKRLFKELNTYKTLIVIAFTLAILGSILSILAPNRLSDLTDEISNGLVINQDNMEALNKKASQNLTEEKLTEILPEILSPDMSETTIREIMTDNGISNKDKETFQTILSELEDGNQTETFQKLASLPDSILQKIFKDSKYEGQTITSEDKINLIKQSDDMSQINLSESLQNIFFEEVTIDGIKISPKDQYEYLKTLNSLDKDADESELYKTLDTLPKSVRAAIEPVMDMGKIKGITLLLVCMYLASAIFTYIQSICMTNVSNKFANNLRNQISVKINKLPLKYFDQHQVGDILSRVTNDVDMIAQSMNQSLASLVSSVTLFLGSIIMMFITNWLLALTAILSSLIGFIGMALILKKSQKYFLQRQTELGNLNDYIGNMNKINGGNSPKIKKAGKQTVDGNQAVAYCRIRYVGNGDFRRTERQRTVIEQIAKKAKSTNPITLTKIVNEVLPHIQTSFDSLEVLSLAKDVFRYKIVETQGFPFNTTGTKLSGIYYGIPTTLHSNVIEAHKFLFGTENYTPSDTVTNISNKIINYTGIQ